MTKQISRYGELVKYCCTGELNTYDWSVIFELESCEEKLDCFMTILQSALDMLIPIRTLKVHYNNKPWITRKIKNLILNVKRPGRTVPVICINFIKIDVIVNVKTPVAVSMKKKSIRTQTLI